MGQQITPFSVGRTAATQANVNTVITALNALISPSGATTVTSATPVTLTVGSTPQQWFSGSTAQVVNLPNSTTLSQYSEFTFVNNSSAILSIYAADTTTLLGTIPASGIVVFKVTSIATSNGVWEQAIVTSGTIGTAQNQAWTPADASGAALTFTGVTAEYSYVGNLYSNSVTLTYPTTADVSAAAISGLNSAPHLGYKEVVGYTSNGIQVIGAIAAAATTMTLFDASGVALQNADLSTLTLTLNGIDYAK